MKVLPPIEVPWKMKGLDSAQVTEDNLPFGRLRLSIRHDVLKGVTPAMLVWWFNNMDGEVEIAGQPVNRYRAWHPRDHFALTYVSNAVDGRKFGTGARIRIQEFFGARPENKIDTVETVDFLDETGFAHRRTLFGATLGFVTYKFTAVPGGTLYENSLSLGATAPLMRTLANRVLLPRLFPPAVARAWPLHNIEEVGNWEHFLPALYAARVAAT